MSKRHENPWVVLRIRFNAEWSEWVVHHSDGEPRTYRTDDKDDAIVTRDAMRKWENERGIDVEYIGHCPGGIQFFSGKASR